MRTIIYTLLLLSTNIFAQNTITGIVFQDSDKNNIKSKNEKGIPAVAVSNGREVVLTDDKGEYSIFVSNDEIVFVIKPSNYIFPVNEYNLPQYYYIHKPNGSPKQKFKGVEPTPEKINKVNFPLYKIPLTENFKILVFGDPQPRNKQEIDFYYRGIVKELENAQGISMGISLGDLVYDNLDLFQSYIEATVHIGIPWFNVMGNHDMNYDATSDSLSDETFESYFGPATYSFNHGNVHFIIMDDILYPDPRDGSGYWGGLTKKQFQFIENDLKLVSKNKLIVLASHIPLSEDKEERAPGYDAFNDDHRERLLELIKDYPFTFSISAHRHKQSQDYLTAEDGWKQEGMHHHFNVGTTCGDWYSGHLDSEGIPVSTMRDGTPKGYAIISFNDNNYVIDYKVANRSGEYQINIYAPKVVEQNKGTSAGIAANFFMGSQYDTLYYRVDDGDWKRMYRFDNFDPSYFFALHEWDVSETLLDNKRPSNPDDSKHIWFAGIPTHLDVGKHTIQVKVTDRYGREFGTEKDYRIAVR